jgi:hypothetical protein
MLGAQRVELAHRGLAIGDGKYARNEAALSNVEFGGDGGSEGVRGQMREGSKR